MRMKYNAKDKCYDIFQGKRWIDAFKSKKAAEKKIKTYKARKKRRRAAKKSFLDKILSF